MLRKEVILILIMSLILFSSGNAINAQYSEPNLKLMQTPANQGNFSVNLAFSTFWGGNRSDEILDLVLDRSNNIIVVGLTQSADFPLTTNAYNKDKSFATAISEGEGDFPVNDLFVTKFTPDGSNLLFSTFLGPAEILLTKPVLCG